MGEDIADDSNYVDNGRNNQDEENDLEDLGQSVTEVINIDTGYQPNWGPAEGYRENYQNWKDGIMRSFKISERDFKIEPKDGPREKLYLVHHPNSTPRQLVGFIRFTYDAKDMGFYEMTNFKATLQRRHLVMGGTSKALDKKQMGQHGEGLKLSAVVNRRHPHNYSFIISASGCRWTFGWNVDKKMNCRIQRIPKNELREQKEVASQQAEKGLPRETKGRVWEDVSVVVGEPRRCRSLAGEVQMTNKIPLAEFLKWTKMTIDITPPVQIIRTDEGDLILDPNHKNKVYLHSLLLPSGSKSGRDFHFGYNLLDAATGRDRDTLTDARAEANKIAAILEEYRLGKADLIEKYVQLLLNKYHSAADVYDVEKHITNNLAKLIWSRMLISNNEPSFYYCGRNDLRGYVQIKERLRLKPIALDYSLWHLLRAHNLCLTPQEECLRRLRRATNVELKQDCCFSQHIIRGLRALLTSDTPWRNKEIVPVNGQELGIVTVYHEGKIKIDHAYFTYDGAHKATYCADKEDGRENITRTFTCDHVLLWLWDQIILARDDMNAHEEGFYG
ncbi:hypothetical protein BDV95DRAFT_612068 [Massariosphaeria phaeospora]|uniref:Uncharacterized protein n=1 Tax=Massariosphaeria phaeospora TaxID=100035 RepID=A0A7C8I0Y1_9PLEO|nr:hypothetical protein BDV95DRAFT_612068 [Massariosphaeria phaeospora]